MTATVVACAATMGVATSGAAAARREPARPQLVAVLRTSHTVRSGPSATSRRLTFVVGRRPITGERTTLPVLSRTDPPRGQSWLRVRLPGRGLGQNGQPEVGWISAHNTQLFTTPWQIAVDLGARRVTIYYDNRVLRVFPAIVGKPSTPTPTGYYFVEENVHLGPYAAGGPYALATSDRSDVLQEFDGGPGQIALHGLDNLGGTLGTAESHGCIRLADSAIVWLAARIGPGVSVTIR